MNDTAQLDRKTQAPKRRPSRRPGEARRQPVRAHRGGHQRFRRGRTTLRPIARGHRRAKRQRNLDRRDHSRRDPAAGAKRGWRQRNPHPHRDEAGDQRRRRDRSRRGLQRAGAPGPGPRGRIEARRHDPPGERLARQPRRLDREVLQRDRRGAREERLPRDRDPARARVPRPHDRCPARQEHVRARHALQHLQLRPADRPRAGCAHVRQEGPLDHRHEREAPRGGVRVGGGEPRLQVRDSGAAQQGGPGRDQRQYGDRAGRPRLRHGHLRDVPDHAGDFRVALPVRLLREGGRHRPPGRGRDRRLRLRDRRLLRGPLRRDHHFRPGLLSQAGGPGTRRHGRDPARGGERPARRTQHRPADEGRAGRSPHGDLWQPRRRARKW